MKKIVAVILVVVFIATGLGGVVYAQSNGHEPMTGQKLVGTADLGKVEGGLVRWFFSPDLRIYNPDSFAEITIERMLIIAEDGNVVYDGPFLRTPTYAPSGPPEVMTRPLKPHEAWECFLPACIPDGAGGWLPLIQVNNRPRATYTLEICWSGAEGGCPLSGEVVQTSQLTNLWGQILSEATATRALERMEQIVTPLPPKDSIVIGAARPLTGPQSVFEESCFGLIYKMWVDEVNARGGIYVEEYGKSLPIELLVYDDESDVATMVDRLEQLMEEDKVDFVLSPATSIFIHAAAPVFNEHGYILVGAEGGSASIAEMLPGTPYFFGVLNYSDRYQLPVFADLMAAEGAKTAAIIYIQDLHGIEYSGVAVQEFDRVGIEVVMIKSSIPYTTDLELLLEEARDSGADILCVFCYPPTTWTVAVQAQALGANFDAVMLGPGGNFESYKEIYGADIIEGVMGEGAWNCNSTPGAADFCNKFIARYGVSPMDWWGNLLYYAGLEFFEQAIVEAGTLDQAVIREVMATHTFETSLGPTWFETIGGGGCLLAADCYPGQVGQWQNGVFEVIAPAEKATAAPVYPKPLWPGTTQNNQAHAIFHTFWDYFVEGGSFSNGEVTGTKAWFVDLYNQADITGAPLTDVGLRLDSGLAFDNVGVSNGTLVTEGPPVYEWSFADVVQDPLVYEQPHVNVGFWGDPHPFPVSFTPGFDASRAADQTVFLRSGVTQTQNLTIAVTPREQLVTGNWGLYVGLPTWSDLVDAVILPPTGVDFELAPDGQQLWMWPTGLTVGVEWTVNITIELTPVPQGAYEAPQVEFMPHVNVGLFENLASGYVEGNSVSHPAGDPADGVGSWTWSATGEGDLGWNWVEAVARNVNFESYCREYE